MNLDEAQKQKVATWLDQGLKLSEIQAKLAAELGVKLTYMEVRFLVDDLKLTPKDPEPPKVEAPANAQASGDAATADEPMPDEGAADGSMEEDAAPPGAGQVSVTVDALAKPGMVVSGGVTFSDGNKAAWYLDQYGRLGVAPEQQGYKPPPVDVQSFQLALQRELQKLGF